MESAKHRLVVVVVKPVTVLGVMEILVTASAVALDQSRKRSVPMGQMCVVMKGRNFHVYRMIAKKIVHSVFVVTQGLKFLVQHLMVINV